MADKTIDLQDVNPSKYHYALLEQLVGIGQASVRYGLTAWDEEDASDEVNIRFDEADLIAFNERWLQVSEDVVQNVNSDYGSHTWVFKDSTTGKFWKLVADQDSWVDDSALGEYEWFEVFPKEVTKTVYERADL